MRARLVPTTLLLLVLNLLFWAGSALAEGNTPWVP